jgi:hypothetical protein
VTTGDVVLDILIVGGSVVVIVLAAVVFARSRGDGTATLLGRSVHRPRLLAAAAVCGGVSGLLFEMQEHMPRSWQGVSLSALSALESALEMGFLVLFFTYAGSQLRAKRRG